MHTRDHYFARDNPVADERARLDRITALYDPASRQRIVGLPVLLEGARVLEVAGGTGSVAAWLADQTGAAVVVTDLDTRHLEACGNDRFDVRHHDILAGPPETEAFDLVHARLLISHLVGDESLAIRNMVGALRPGGWLVVEDTDYTVGPSLVRDYPGGPAIERLRNDAADDLRAARLLDSRAGRHVPDYLARAGLDDLGHDGRVAIQRGGDGWATQIIEGYGLLEERLRGTIVDDKTWQTAMAAWRDPDYAFVSPLDVGAWGRKPK
ncbi:MAG: class I SAM-dependent methyltransferase [Pseudomonadota bacterium]